MAVQLRHDMNAQEVSITCWSAAHFFEDDASQHAVSISLFFSRAAELSSTFNPQNAANVLWAAAKLSIEPSSTLFCLLEASSGLSSIMKPVRLWLRAPLPFP
jgi:hypothetical protein